MRGDDKGRLWFRLGGQGSCDLRGLEETVWGQGDMENSPSREMAEKAPGRRGACAPLLPFKTT
jgi:hypothetical protein